MAKLSTLFIHPKSFFQGRKDLWKERKDFDSVGFFLLKEERCDETFFFVHTSKVIFPGEKRPLEGEKRPLEGEKRPLEGEKRY